MARLYKVEASAEEIGAHFAAEIPAPIDVPFETIEGAPGLVVLEAHGRRVLKVLPWGFPRLRREMRDRGDPPSRIGLVADLTNPLWEELVADPRYRCLVPITHFANPAGRAGEKTRTWFALRGAPLMAWAGFFSDDLPNCMRRSRAIWTRSVWMRSSRLASSARTAASSASSAVIRRFRSAEEAPSSRTANPYQNGCATAAPMR